MKGIIRRPGEGPSVGKNAIRLETLRQDVIWLKQQNKAIWAMLETISGLSGIKEDIEKELYTRTKIRGR